LIRVTISDREQTVSFLADPETLRRLLAACSANPSSLGDLLIAADIYQRGLAAGIMADLMEFDKSLRQQGASGIHAAIRQARAEGKAFAPAFQVFDEITAEEASNPGSDELVAIDLIQQVIRPSAGIAITRSGEVDVAATDKSPRPTVTYILPKRWTMRPLTD
jgi:hypothetical protein